MDPLRWRIDLKLNSFPEFWRENDEVLRSFSSGPEKLALFLCCGLFTTVGDGVPDAVSEDDAVSDPDDVDTLELSDPRCTSSFDFLLLEEKNGSFILASSSQR
jgi:hypothetical protein